MYKSNIKIYTKLNIFQSFCYLAYSIQEVMYNGSECYSDHGNNVNNTPMPRDSVSHYSAFRYLHVTEGIEGFLSCV